MARRKAKKKFRLVRFLTKFVVAVLVLIGIALVGLFMLPAEKIAGIAAARFEAATGRAMVLEGDVRPSLYPALGGQDRAGEHCQCRLVGRRRRCWRPRALRWASIWRR